MSTDWRQAKLRPPEFAMLEFGEKLTLLPSAMTEEDVIGLRAHGFSERDIVSIVIAAAYRNFISRAADALGAELSANATYAPEILQAYGVTEEAVSTTIYADRLTAPDADGTPARQQNPSGRPATAATGVCWVETAPGESLDKLVRLMEPHPLRHLAMALSQRIDALEASIGMVKQVAMGGSGLGGRLEAIIGLTVATTLWVPYMGVHHAQAFLETGGTAEELEALMEGLSGGSLGGQEREVARFSEKETRVPGNMGRSDVEALRRSGFSDRDILTIATSVAVQNYLSRVAAGLGVRTEEGEFDPSALDPFKELTEA